MKIIDDYSEVHDKVDEWMGAHIDLDKKTKVHLKNDMMDLRNENIGLQAILDQQTLPLAPPSEQLSDGSLSGAPEDEGVSLDTQSRNHQ